MVGALVPPLAKAPAYCRRLVLWCEKRGTVGSWQPLNCGSWSCEHCRPFVTQRLRTRLYQAQFVAALFVTLTLDPRQLARRGIGPVEYRAQATWIRRAYTRLIARVRRNFGTTKYVMVKEFQRALDWLGKPNGRLHAHVLLETDADGASVREYAMALGFGAQLDVQLIREVGDCYDYLRKYMTKGQPQSYDFRVRRFSASRGVMAPLVREPSEGTWRLGHVDPRTVDFCMRETGVPFREEGERREAELEAVRAWRKVFEAEYAARRASKRELRAWEREHWEAVDRAAAESSSEPRSSSESRASPPGSARFPRVQSSLCSPLPKLSHGEAW